MKALVVTKYGLGDGLQIQNVEKPMPGDGDILVEVHASCVNTNSLVLVTGRPFFVRLMFGAPFRPKIRIPGSDIAGRVVAVGKNARRFKAGDEVYGEISDSGFGAFAEYVVAPESVLCFKPSNLSFAEAAAVPQAALVALQGLRDYGGIKAGQKVLVYGASGGIGSFAVQIAKHYGAEVTGVCSTKHVDMVKSLGADHVIDYTREDYTKSDKRYDLIFAVAHRSIFDHLRALRPGGIYVSTGSPSIGRIVDDMLIGQLLPKDGGKRVAGGWSAKASADDLLLVKEFVENGCVRPVIDRHYPLRDAAEALRYYGQGHTAGKVVVTVRGE